MGKVTYHCLGCNHTIESLAYTPQMYGETQKGYFHDECLEKHVSKNKFDLSEKEIQGLWLELRNAEKQMIKN